MHIPDNILDPRVTAATGAVAVAGLAVAVRKLGSRPMDRTPVMLGAMAAFLFAAQMVNFPVGPFPFSGHLLGGVLAAVLLGPWAGAVVVAAVLLVQCLLYADGGLLALGANFVNMGLIGAMGGYAIYAPIRRAIGGRAGVLVGAMVAAWFSVILASGAFAVELAAGGGRYAFLDVLGWMALVHAGIGLGEAVITGLVLRSILLTRPDLIDAPEDLAGAGRAGRWGRPALAGLAIALAVAVFLAPFASELDDGLEYVGGRLGFTAAAEEAEPRVASPIPDYEMPGLAVGYATAAAGAVGTLVVFAVAAGLARAVARREADALAPDGVVPDAA